MAIGSLGDITFTVSTVKNLTFKDLKQTKTNKFHQHEIIGNKPLTEFLGCDLDSLTFSIVITHDLMVTPSEVLDKLDNYMTEATPLEFTVGNKSMGVDKWVIENYSNAYDVIYSNGYVYQATVDISLKEYLSDKNLQPNSVVNTISKIKKGIQFYTKAKKVAKTALSGGYNSLVTSKASEILLNVIKV